MHYFLFLLLLVTAQATAQSLEIHHINIGQGDSTLILGPPDGSGDRVVVLMDAGDRGAGGNLDFTKKNTGILFTCRKVCRMCCGDRLNQHPKAEVQTADMKGS